MPSAVGAFIGKVAFFVLDALVAVGVPHAAAVAILDTAIKLAALSFLDFVSQKLSGTPDFATSIQGTQVLVRGTIEHQRIIYGETLVGGVIQYINASGTNNQLLHESIVLAGHECEDITDVWFDDVRISNSAIDWDNDGSVSAGSYSGAVKFEKNLGGSNQSASAVLRSNFSEVTSQHQGRGITYGVAQLRYDEDTQEQWTKGEPNDIKWLVKGKKVYNPSSDSTRSFGTGPHRVNSAATYEWSHNPALIWADYMIDSSLGFGEDPEWIDWGYVASAAAVCSATVFTPVGTSERFTCNGVLHTGVTHEDNIRAILSSFNGSQAEVNGVYKLRAAAYDTPTLEFDDDFLRDDIQIALDEESDNRYNIVRGYFVDKDRNYQPSQFPPFTSSEYLSRDGGEKLYRDIQLLMTNDVYMAQRLAAGILEQGDLQEKIVYPSNFKTIPAEVNGTIMLTNEKMAWDKEPFKVERYVFKDMEGIDLILRKNSPDAYVDVATNEYTVSSNGVYFTPDPGVPAPSSLWLVPMTNGFMLRWTPPAARLYETTRVYWATNNSRDQAIQVADVRGAEFLHVTERPQTSYYWVRSVNYANKLSDFFPNSGQTGVSGAPSISGTFMDYSFDFSDDVSAFWTTYPDLLGAQMKSNFTYQNPSSVVVGSVAIVGSGAVGGGSVMRWTHVGSTGTFDVAAIGERAVHKIMGENLVVNVKYLVNSLSSVGSVDGLIVHALGWGAHPLYDQAGTGGDGSGKPAPSPSSWTNLGHLEKYIPFSEMDDTGMAVFNFNLSSLSVLGAKYVSVGLGFRFVANGRHQVDFDQVVVGWTGKTYEGYQLKDVAGTIASNRLSLNYDNANSVYVRVGAHVNSITVAGWPASGTLGELAITFQRSGSSTAVVRTTAWPSGTKWNGGKRLVLTTNSGGYGRVLLSTRDGGATILADRADEYS